MLATSRPSTVIQLRPKRSCAFSYRVVQRATRPRTPSAKLASTFCFSFDHRMGCRCITNDNLWRPTRRAEEHYTKNKLSIRRGAVHDSTELVEVSTGRLCDRPFCADHKQVNTYRWSRTYCKEGSNSEQGVNAFQLNNVAIGNDKGLAHLQLAECKMFLLYTMPPVVVDQC